MKKLTALLVAATAIVAAAPATAAPIFSEDFSNGFGAFTKSGRVDIARGSVEYAACCSATGSQANLDNPFAAFGGGNEQPGFITAQLATDLGQEYELTFRYAVLGGGAATIRAVVGGQVFLIPGVADNNFDTTFKTFTTRFTGAGDQSIRLGFTSPGADINVDVGLDDVNVTAVPEPATWAMMLLGFGMVAGAARYRRRSTNVTYA